MHLTLRQLRYFVEIVDAGNMTRAAGHLHVTPTAVSHQIRLLEDHLGRVLLMRHSRGVTPTAKGTELYRVARNVLDMVDDAERILTKRRGAQETLRLGIIPSIAKIAGFDLATKPMRRGANMVVEIVQEMPTHLLAEIVKGDIDLLLGSEIKPIRDVRSIQFLRERLVFARTAVGAPKRTSVTLREVLASGLVVHHEDSLSVRMIQRAVSAAGLTWRVERAVASLDVIRQLVGHGTNTTIMPYAHMQNAVRSGAVAVFEIADYPVTRTLSLLGTPRNLAEAEAAGAVDHILTLVTCAHMKSGPYYEPIAYRPLVID